MPPTQNALAAYACLYLPSGLARDLSVEIDVIEEALISVLTTAASPYGTD